MAQSFVPSSVVLVFHAPLAVTAYTALLVSNNILIDAVLLVFCNHHVAPASNRPTLPRIPEPDGIDIEPERTILLIVSHVGSATPAPSILGRRVEIAGSPLDAVRSEYHR